MLDCQMYAKVVALPWIHFVQELWHAKTKVHTPKANLSAIKKNNLVLQVLLCQASRLFQLWAVWSALSAHGQFWQ